MSAIVTDDEESDYGGDRPELERRLRKLEYDLIEGPHHPSVRQRVRDLEVVCYGRVLVGDTRERITELWRTVYGPNGPRQPASSSEGETTRS